MTQVTKISAYITQKHTMNINPQFANQLSTKKVEDPSHKVRRKS